MKEKALFDGLGFGPAEILLPRGCDLHRWSVAACDQYTSQPEYWQRVEELVGDAPSALRLILPEAQLGWADTPARIQAIHAAMEDYQRQGLFETLPDSLIYVERTLDSGGVRRGLVGQVDLECYDYAPEADTLIRATEGTVAERIPPRLAVRRQASLELPHVMLLVDDPDRQLLEPLAAACDRMKPLYRFPLMEGGGRLAGWQLGAEQLEQTAAALRRLADPAGFAARYQAPGRPVLLYAVGDGNHSLATARALYQEQRANTPPEERHALPSRYALVELVNLHDPALVFEPIHRVVFGAEPRELLAGLQEALPQAEGRLPPEQAVTFIWRGGVRQLRPADPHRLPAAAVQQALDSWLEGHPQAGVDYIHGGDVAEHLAREREDAAALLLPPMDKHALFKTVIFEGALPRKTFSMGEAQHKRFYLEARRIAP